MKALDAPRTVSKRGSSWMTSVPREALGALTQADNVEATWHYDWKVRKWTVRFEVGET